MKYNFHLSDSIKRAIWSSLSIVEELLLELENLVQDEEDLIFIEIKNTINSEKREIIKKEIEEIRDSLKDIKKTLNLKKDSIDNTNLILSKCAKLWEILCDSETKKLKGYGTPPENLSDYLDPIIYKIIHKIEFIRDLVSKK